MASAEAPPQWLTLSNVRGMLGLGDASVTDVAARFARATNDDGMLTRTAFNRVFESLVPNPSRTQAARLRVVLSHLFSLFDVNGDGMVDFTELSSGLSILCGGNRDDRIRAAFALYDFNGDGHISLEEMTQYLASVFRVMFATQPAVKDRVAVSPEELAVVTASQCFKDADLDSDGKLTWEEFRAWYQRTDLPGSDGTAGSGSAQRAVLAAAAAPRPEWVSLPEIKRLTNLQQYSVEDVMEEFAQFANAEGLLSRGAFNACFNKFVRPESDEDSRRTRLVLAHLFDLFDADSSGMVDFRELASGLSVLCGGSRDEKIGAAFSLFDFNGGCLYCFVFSSLCVPL